MDQVLGGKTVSGLSENELLGRFVATGDETAFTALVIRHGPMVLGVCRRLLRDVNDVEDAFQATFLVLARRASAIERRHLLAPWLHGVARRVAVRARAKGATRNARELALEFVPEAETARDSSPEEQLAAKELRGLIDNELARLPDSLRKPLVLCYLEGLTHDEAARELRWPVGTVRSRMARARAMLRNRLARQGHSATGMAIVGNLTREALPRTLLDATVRASLGFTSGKIPASATALALAKGVLGLMFLQKAMVVGVVVLAATVSVAGAFGYQAGPPGPDEIAAQTPANPNNAATRNAEKLPEKPELAATRQIDQLKRSLEASTAKLNALQDEIAKLQATIKALKPGSADQDMTPMVEPGVGKGGSDRLIGTKAIQRRMLAAGVAGNNRLSFVREASLICVVSPEGNRATEFDMETGKSYVIEFDPGLKAVPVAMGEGTMTAIGFLAKDENAEVKQLAVFDKLPIGTHLNQGQKGSAWMTKDLEKPIKGTVTPSPLTNGVFFELGNQIHAYSKQYRTWSQLTLPEGPHRGPKVDETLLMYEADGHLHIYDTRVGKWIDINSRESKTP